MSRRDFSHVTKFAKVYMVPEESAEERAEGSMDREL